MPRQPRIEYPGADFLVTHRAARLRASWDAEVGPLFEACLSEAAVRSGWIVHAWQLGGGRVYLALQTPEPTLSVGMQWLWATVAARLAAQFPGMGSVFHDRYRSVVVEPGAMMARVCQAIDAESLRAAARGGQGFSSLRFVARPEVCPSWCLPTLGLAAAGLAGGGPGIEAYRHALAVTGGRQGRQGTQGEPLPPLDRGWVLGSEDFRQRMLDRRGGGEPPRSPDDGERSWAAHLESLLKRLPAEARTDERVSAVWRAVLAYLMKTQTTAKNQWLATALRMGSSTFVSKQVGLVR
ncbi:MAG: hypothetical protein JNN01_03725, partial [Opitutaceae bacterium]|nr:hypothetical protein [Opitutaceae bacterium]